MGQVFFKPAATLAVAAALLVAGCGDDEPTPITPVDSGATGATGAEAGAITPEELIDEGDPICAEAYTALVSAPANVTGAQQASIVEGLVESMQSLGDPGTENEDDLDDFYDSLQDARKAYEDDDTLTAEAALADARSAADRYGFKDCGDEGQALDGTTDSSDTSSDDSTSAPTTEPAPTEPVTPAPTPEPSTPPAGGTDTDTPTDGGSTDSGTDSGGTDGSGSGGVSP